MSLDKAIEHGKEHRKQYTGAKAVSYECRNHGSCEYCLDNRIRKYKKKLHKTQLMLQEYEAGLYDDMEDESGEQRRIL